MFSPSEKTTRPSSTVQRKTGDATFFRKAGDEGFFGGKEQSSFFSPAIQPKLNVSSPDDPQEKEADAMAEQVMRMPEPTAAPEQKEEEKIQAKLSNVIQRSADDSCVDCMADTGSSSGSDYTINRKNTSIHNSDIIQRSSRGPPASSIPFEQSLSSSKGGGSALPGDTKQFMESRFGADFSGVRIHTGSSAESLSNNIHAQAFTHGNDIYFNSGKYAPHTEGGSLLLAHELTHTIQQGASSTVSSTNGSASSSASVSAKPISVSRKQMIQRSPVQLTNAVAKAKSMEGKINAKLPGPDGYRTGWQHLLDIFKTTFGEDKIVSGAGGSSVPGTISEMDIKKYRETTGAVPIKGDPSNIDKNGTRDALPSWCGIFVFWALNKGGVPMPKWKLGENVIKPEAVHPSGSGYTPKPGDIAWRRAYSHFAIVESVSGDTVKTVNGNTAGSDNMGGQVQAVDHKTESWAAFFDPLMTATGPLTTGEAPANTRPLSFEELRKEVKVNKKEEEHEAAVETEVQPKQELSSWNVNSEGTLARTKAEPKEEEKKEEDDKQSLANQPGVQKKHDVGIQCKCNCDDKEESGAQEEHEVQAKTETGDSSLNSYTDAATEEQSDEMDRGPPVQAKQITGVQRIQRLILPVGALNAAKPYTECFKTDLNEAKKCGLRKANKVALEIPGFKALCVVLNKNPITGDTVDRSGRNFIEAAMDLMPGGSLLHKKLDEQKQLDSAAQWIDGKIGEVAKIVNMIESRVAAFFKELKLSDFTSPETVLRNAANILLSFIESVVKFAVDTAKELLEMVKKFLLAKIVEFIKNKTTAYPLLTVILGEDPITKQKIDPTGENILNAILELGGEAGKQQRDLMKETGTFKKIAAYIDEGILVFSNLYTKIVESFTTIWSKVTIDDLMNPSKTFEKIYTHFADPVLKVLDFVKRVAEEILKLVKEVLFKRISAEAKKIRGYYLVTVILGKDPFTSDEVPRTTENLIHGFMSLMSGGEEQFQQMKESGAIGEATAKIDAAVKKLDMTPESIIQLIEDVWKSVKLSDLLRPIETFKRVIAQFGEPIGRLIEFVVEIVKIVVEVILVIMEFPTGLIRNIISKAMKAFHLIKQDPIGFIRNLLKAIKEGFIQFFDNIIQHLIQGLVAWLTSELKEAGVPELKDLSLKGIISWVLEVLGISMEKIWEKLAKHPKIGPAKVAKIRGAINTLSGIWDFIKDVQERGMAAIWDKIAEQLNNLWDTVLNAVKDWIMDKIINAVVTKLLSMLDPTGIMAVINSAIAIYRAIKTFIKHFREMLEIVNSFVEGVYEIASGNTKKAANFLERTLAKAIPIVIGFLADQVGLGGIGKKIGEMIEKAREMVDKAIEWLVNKAVDTALGLIDRLMGRGGTPEGEPAPEPVPNDPEAHRQLAMQAKTELENTPVTATNPTEALTQKQETARKIEDSYSSRLQAPLRMTITLTEESHTESVEHVATRIVIAPNDTVVEETIVINLADGPTTLEVGTPIRRNDGHGWTHGLIKAITDTEGVGKTVSVLFGMDKGGSKNGPVTSKIPVSRLQADLAMPPDSVPVGSYALGGEAPDHRMFEPKDLVEIYSNPSGTKLTYKTHADAEFTVTVDNVNETHTVEGQNLQLKDWAGVEGRGITEETASYIKGVNLHKAHLIADRFLGTGFAKGQNLITTSAKYNLTQMSRAENSLVSQLVKFEAESFDLTVVASFGAITSSAVQSAIIASVPEDQKGPVEAAVTAFASVHSGFKVCLSVTYNGMMKKKSPDLTKSMSAGPLGPDTYLKI